MNKGTGLGLAAVAVLAFAVGGFLYADHKLKSEIDIAFADIVTLFNVSPSLFEEHLASITAFNSSGRICPSRKIEAGE